MIVWIGQAPRLPMTSAFARAHYTTDEAPPAHSGKTLYYYLLGGLMLESLVLSSLMLLTPGVFAHKTTCTLQTLDS